MANRTIHGEEAVASEKPIGDLVDAGEILSIAARMTEAMTTFTRASHPPLAAAFSIRREQGEQKKGSASPMEQTSIPKAGRAPPPAAEAASKVPTKDRRTRTKRVRTSGP